MRHEMLRCRRHYATEMIIFAISPSLTLFALFHFTPLLSRHADIAHTLIYAYIYAKRRTPATLDDYAIEMLPSAYAILLSRLARDAAAIHTPATATLLRC